MDVESGLAEAAQLFKVLGSESRLELLYVIGREPRTVGSLAEATGMSQPLVSQHLRLLRQSGLVSSTRKGKAITYQLADEHVSHVINDALAHAREHAEGSSTQHKHDNDQQHDNHHQGETP